MLGVGLLFRLTGAASGPVEKSIKGASINDLEAGVDTAAPAPVITPGDGTVFLIAP